MDNLYDQVFVWCNEHATSQDKDLWHDLKRLLSLAFRQISLVEVETLEERDQFEKFLLDGGWCKRKPDPENLFPDSEIARGLISYWKR